MSVPHHYTAHQDDKISFWVVAHVHKLDTHADWSAEWFYRRDDGSSINSGWIFRNYKCDARVLREFVRRGIVSQLENAVVEHVSENLLAELNEKCSEPDNSIWFELVIDTFTEDAVSFSFSVWAYKYQLVGATLPKQLYYLFADRLCAKVRFVHEWFALESVSNKLTSAMSRGRVLPRVAPDIAHELALLRSPTEIQLQASCRSLFPVLERAMREYIEAKTGKRAGTLDELVNRFASDNLLNAETIELLRVAIKPQRDYLAHGRQLPTFLTKLTLAILLEVMARLGEVDV